jgi:hypothetical protein
MAAAYMENDAASFPAARKTGCAWLQPDYREVTSLYQP